MIIVHDLLVVPIKKVGVSPGRGDWDLLDGLIIVVCRARQNPCHNPKQVELPKPCWEKILSFLNDVELKKFIKHASPWNSEMAIKRKICPDESEFCQDAK